MKIGDVVKTIDGKQGEIKNIFRMRPTDAILGVRYLVNGVWWYTDQLTLVELEPQMYYCARPEGLCFNFSNAQQLACRDCRFLRLSDNSYAQRLQWAWDEELPMETLYICESAKECNIKCLLKEGHINNFGCTLTCKYHNAKCIPVDREDNDWFVINDVNPLVGTRLTKAQAVQAMKLWGGRAFKWSQGLHIP